MSVTLVGPIYNSQISYQFRPTPKRALSPGEIVRPSSTSSFTRPVQQTSVPASQPRPLRGSASQDSISGVEARVLILEARAAFARAVQGGTSVTTRPSQVSVAQPVSRAPAAAARRQSTATQAGTPTQRVAPPQVAYYAPGGGIQTGSRPAQGRFANGRGARSPQPVSYQGPKPGVGVTPVGLIKHERRGR